MAALTMLTIIILRKAEKSLRTLLLRRSYHGVYRCLRSFMRSRNLSDGGGIRLGLNIVGRPRHLPVLCETDDDIERALLFEIVGETLCFFDVVKRLCQILRALGCSLGFKLNGLARSPREYLTSSYFRLPACGT